MTVLVIAEHDNAALKSATLHAVAAAAAIGSDVRLLVAGSGCRAVAEQAAAVAGVSGVLIVDAPHYADGLAENVAAWVAATSEGCSHVLVAATSFGRNVLPRIAALLDCAQVSDIVAVIDGGTFVRPIYAGSALATVKSVDRVKLLSVRTTAFDAAGTGSTQAPIESMPPGPDLGLSTLLGRELTKSERPELTAARVVVSGGCGLGSAEAYRTMLEPLADKLGAGLGASRAAVDAGYAPNDSQVGQTGKIVAPQLYVAVGISGAIQHLAGMKDSGCIVAINKDEEAPIFQVADYGLVADLFQAVPDFVQAL
jgi:electron transfer flavoprotein alpha subunit